MEGSGETDCSKTTCPSNQNEDEEESEDNNNNGRKPKDGGSSSSSTIEENEKKTLVRPYVRSKTPRLRWTNDLHLRFVQAVERLGGQERATPKLVLEMMDIKELSIAHVKSHLQMYRSKKIDDPSQVVGDHRYHLGGGDTNIYNLSQLPMLQGYNQRHHSTFRYGDASRIVNGDAKWIPSPFMGMSSIDRSSPRFYGTIGERIFGSNYRCSTISTFDQQSAWRTHGLKHEFAMNTMKLNPLSTQPQSRVPNEQTTMKRKASNCDLDLSLSLGLKSRNEENKEEEEEESGLSLSLYSPSSLKVRKLINEDDDRREDGRRASTLDLTI